MISVIAPSNVANGKIVRNIIQNINNLNALLVVLGKWNCELLYNSLIYYYVFLIIFYCIYTIHILLIYCSIYYIGIYLNSNIITLKDIIDYNIILTINYLDPHYY